VAGVFRALRQRKRTQKRPAPQFKKTEVEGSLLLNHNMRNANSSEGNAEREEIKEGSLSRRGFSQGDIARTSKTKEV